MIPNTAVRMKLRKPIVATSVPTSPTAYAAVKGNLSLAMREDMKACGPFSIANELSKVIEPNANSKENF